MTELLTAKTDFVTKTLAGTIRDDWNPPPSVAEEGEDAIVRFLESVWDAAPGTYRFLERCRELNVSLEAELVTGVYSSWDQTEGTLPDDAPEEIKQRLRGIAQVQEAEHAAENARWHAEQRRREQGF